MSKLFSHAKKVITWLGYFPNLQPDIRSIRNGLLDFHFATAEEDDHTSTPPHWTSDSSLQSTGWIGASVRSQFLHTLCKSEYWRRAWVIQEIVLAKQVLVVVHSSLIDLSLILPHLQIWDPPSQLNILREGKVSLLFRLDHLRDQGCSIPQDRIFYVLGLVYGVEEIEVDYDLPLATLAFKVLQVYRRTEHSDERFVEAEGETFEERLVRHERHYNLYLCSVFLVVQTLGLNLRSEEWYDVGPYEEVDMAQHADVFHNGCSQLEPMIARLRKTCGIYDPISNLIGSGMQLAAPETIGRWRLRIIRVVFWATSHHDIADIVRTCTGTYRQETPILALVGIGHWNIAMDRSGRKSHMELMEPLRTEALYIRARKGWSFVFTKV